MSEEKKVDETNNIEETQNHDNMPNDNKTDPKVIAIISYITFVGWLAALILQQNSKAEFSSFHIRQSLGIHLLSAVSWVVVWIPVVGWVVGIFIFVLWLLGLISAIQDQMKPLPVVGDYFQDWFKSL